MEWLFVLMRLVLGRQLSNTNEPLPVAIHPDGTTVSYPPGPTRYLSGDKLRSWLTQFLPRGPDRPWSPDMAWSPEVAGSPRLPADPFLDRDRRVHWSAVRPRAVRQQRIRCGHQGQFFSEDTNG